MAHGRLEAAGGPPARRVDSRVVPDRRKGPLLQPPSRSILEKSKEGGALRPIRDRRKEARYIPALRRAQIGWWDAGTFRTAEVWTENLSRSGAALLAEDFPAEARTVLLRLSRQARADWYAARVVAVSRPVSGTGLSCADSS